MFGLSPNLCVHVWDEIEDALPSGDDFPSAVHVVICESLWNGGYNGSGGSDYIENLQEMGKD